MKCGACQRACRSTQRAHVATPDGNVRRALVCGVCFRNAIHLVPAITNVVKGVDETTAKRRESKEVVSGAVKKLRALATAYPNERGEGLEQAADLLEAGDY